jgi:7-cyano-7-deazaguanine synthase in queuosine biosynthesis
MRFRVRTDPREDAGADGEILLDWFEDDRAGSTVWYDAPQHPFLKGLVPSPVAMDLLRLGGAVFCADKIALREHAPDAWTRELTLTLPVSDPNLWSTAAALVENTLGSLSGDRWSTTFILGLPREDDEHEDTEEGPVLPAPAADAVTLFSGGLDSLAGAIELLEDGQTLILVGHHDSPFTDHIQTELFRQLAGQFAAGQATQRRLLLRPAPRNNRQARALPGGPGEITTRTRSLLFLSAGVAVADALGAGTTLYLPENGMIGVNVPLTAARVGSLSTRTTHPRFISHMVELLGTLGLDHPLENPFRLATKGEALVRSPRRDILDPLALASVSCSHPEAARWHTGRKGNCGYCYPCMIRRASLHRIGLDDASEYDRDALTDIDLLSRTDLESGRDLRALLASLGQPARTVDVLRNGRIPGGETRAFFELYCRGRDELRAWLTDGGSAAIIARLG